ncbi:hypothetical protein L910_1170 [Vibrio fluvialis PG41]|uniref:Uncharacterized protein n=1 Tax=Vibrio fluvialis PG41 TaxID=1336752 RepID=S7JBW9_VIBFL|nr:hypothetical protein [Vibrio fluvialis]EPP21491.1 hypothetical protein L910_1170 [Vibrio fluvialis PG41]
MPGSNLSAEIRLLIVEMNDEVEHLKGRALKEPEKSEHYYGYIGGINEYRTKLELILEKSGNRDRPVTIDQ